MKHRTGSNERYLCEVEVTTGLESVSQDEITERFGKVVVLLPQERAGEIQFHFTGSLGQLRSLQTVYAAYVVYEFDIPRPRALLGDAHFRRLLAQIELVQDLSSGYGSFSVAAAGSDSSVMRRIKEEIAAHTGLLLAEEKGDLFIRIRPYRSVWQTLIRLSPRPLVTRAWRVCNLEGALNAATAHAMIRLGQPKTTDVFLNIGCGSGTLLIERASYGDAARIIGVDHDPNALNCTRTNIAAANETHIEILHADMTRLPLSDAVVNCAAADLPFGQLMGDHETNVNLYPRVLNEMGRVIAAGGRFVVITHEMRLMDRLLSKNHQWTSEQAIQVNLRGLHPKIYVLRRTTSRV
mgnify:CR=1 FL=1